MRRADPQETLLWAAGAVASGGRNRSSGWQGRCGGRQETRCAGDTAPGGRSRCSLRQEPLCCAAGAASPDGRGRCSCGRRRRSGGKPTPACAGDGAPGGRRRCAVGPLPMHGGMWRSAQRHRYAGRQKPLRLVRRHCRLFAGAAAMIHAPGGRRRCAAGIVAPGGMSRCAGCRRNRAGAAATGVRQGQALFTRWRGAHLDWTIVALSRVADSYVAHRGLDNARPICWPSGALRQISSGRCYKVQPGRKRCVGLCHVRKFWTFLKIRGPFVILCEKVAGSPVVGVHTRGLVSVFHTRWPRCGVFVVSPEGPRDGDL